MATQTTTADGGRTDSKRFEDDVDATELIEGDRIDRALVAPELSMVGQRSHADDVWDEIDDAREYQIARVTATDRMDDTHNALLLDPETGVFARATRHDSQSAWTQREADWTVRDVGAEVVVEEVHELDLPADEQPDADEDPQAYAEEWVDVIFGDLAAGHDDYKDERSLSGGDRLTLRDADGRKVVASISLASSEDVTTYELRVDADTVINGLKINDRPGERRTILFRPRAGGGYGEGVLRDVRGMHWDGEAPPQLRPQAFVPDHDHGPGLLETMSEGARIAEEEGDDPEEAREVAAEIWEEDMRAMLQERIVVEPRFPEETKTVYEIEYVDEADE